MKKRGICELGIVTDFPSASDEKKRKHFSASRLEISISFIVPSKRIKFETKGERNSA
jgi:hypothetical protein